MLEEALKRQVIGQDEAIATLASCVRASRLGIKDPRRPIGAFLFTGPTGVGKTELAKALARELYGKEDALIHLNMGEYQEGFSATKIIGSPPGYVGYDEGGQLTEQVRRRPYSVILFDEIEKAHTDIFHLLLQVMDEGVLTDARGKQVDFRNTVLIMTSNLGASSLTSYRPFGFSLAEDASETEKKADQQVKEALKGRFPPEFINRLDSIVVFRPLSADSLYTIAEQLLAQAAERLKAAGITVLVTPSLVRFIADSQNDKAYGARPLRRAVTRHVENEIAARMLGGEVKAGDRITLSYENGCVQVKKEAPVP